MEIERKFLLEQFPPDVRDNHGNPIPVENSVIMFQGYLSDQTPTVRIRKAQEQNGNTTYRLCFKGKGTLIREEIEMDLTAEQYQQLESLLAIPPIKKDFITYRLPSGDLLECNLVEEGTPEEFRYAEVEFPSIEAANAFQPPSFLGKDVTEEPGYSMSALWRRKKERLLGKNK